MARPITLFTGQWADLPLEEVAKLASGWGYDGLELACWGDHLDPWRWDDDGLRRRASSTLLEKYGLKVWAISNHLKGQAVCDDPIDQRHQRHRRLEGVGRRRPRGGASARRRGDEEHRAARREARRGHGDRLHRLVDLEVRRDVPAGHRKRRSTPGTRTSPTAGTPSSTSTTRWACKFAHEVHPSEIAYDYWTTVRTLEAIGHREAFGLNWDPSHMVWQDLDPVAFLWDFKDRIYHVDCKDTRKRMTNGRNGRLGSHLAWADAGAGGTSSLPATATCRGRTRSGCSTRSATQGPISVEWEDAGMDRLVGRARGARVRAAACFRCPDAAFDAAFSSKD